MRELKVHIAFTVLLGAMFSPHIYLVAAQDSREVTVNKDGWLVPGRDEFKIESKVTRENIDGVEVTHRILKSPAEIFVDASGNRTRPFTTRKSDGQLFSVRGFSVYEANGRTFAYAVSLVPVDMTKRGKLYYKSYIGAMYSLFYLDEDGDGIFESRYGGSPLPNLPAWARRNV